MAVHLPLSIEAQVEAHTLMMATNNIFSLGQRSADYQPVARRGYGLLLFDDDPPCEPAWRRDGLFVARRSAALAYSLGVVKTQRLNQGPSFETSAAQDRQRTPLAKPGALIDTTVGRVIFNSTLPDWNVVLQHPDAVQ